MLRARFRSARPTGLYLSTISEVSPVRIASSRFFKGIGIKTSSYSHRPDDKRRGKRLISAVLGSSLDLALDVKSASVCMSMIKFELELKPESSFGGPEGTGIRGMRS